MIARNYLTSDHIGSKNVVKVDLRKTKTAK